MAMTATDHNRLLGTLIMVRGGLMVLVGLLVGVCMAGAGVLAATTGHRHDDHIAGGFMIAGGVVGGIFVIAFGLLDLYTGTMIRRAAPIGRTLGLVVCSLMLLSFPLGTALGVYGLWFLLGDMGKALYAATPAPVRQDPTPPAPNSWA